MLRQSRRANQRGQIFVLVALVLTLVLGGLLAGVADFVVYTSEQAQADAAADLGAVSGTQAVDVAALSAGITNTSQLRLNGADAQSSCHEAASVADPGANVGCAVNGSTVTAHITKHIRLPIPVFGLGSTITANHEAGAALGTVQPY
jgi:hypothetical protein